ncbi:site-specific DNA-methyltransferase [Paludifilum halophilum]|uniref:Type III restriction endonuclease subunit M n=1 Tax=Paludifilum halophilum TaxID=1642702 RepID=A0A235B795_9BACL|nr:site-specific DNA-methyltransferase [Paludifilum halophilum]OYD08183.1 type III restriction endonuclease subunit M [Paludifilum halophilum]
MKTKINKEIRNVLEKFGDKYFVEGNVNKSKVIQDLDAYDKDLLSAFIENETIKENFAITINGHMVLQTNKLIELFEADEYWQDSFTKYSKKIGLTAGGKFIDESTDVVLDFPYKDTILKASMSKEDTDKDDLRPDEPFLNEVIAKEEIDVLLDKKILVNAKKYTQNGVEDIDHFNENDNLIIKGNNLLALHTLKLRYAGKVKACFIDPPYFFYKNKPADTFSYNSNFKLSSWLVFMQNRLSITKDLLSEDGVIYITISSEGGHYLKVLVDNVFGMENFIADITWQSRKSVSSDGLISVSSNHILVYAKNINIIKKDEFRLFLDTDGFKYDDNDGRGKYRIEPFDAPNIRKNLEYPIKNPNTGKIYYPPEGRCWRTTYEDYIRLLKDNRIRFGAKGQTKPQLKVYLKDVKQMGKGKASTTIWSDLTPDSILWSETGTTTNGTKHQQKMFGKVVFENPKPEDLISRSLQLATDENDIVLDFFMGSATTQAVAHKMNRRYIGIEQMDYINTVSVPRLQKVIEGEQGGISKDVNWQGGGSFVYVELMEKNRGFLKAIRDAKNHNELQKVFDFMLEEAEIDFRVDLEKIKDTLHELSLDDQKRTLIKIIDKNQLYYNYSEIDDENVRDLISDSDYAFNKSFYEEGEE